MAFKVAVQMDHIARIAIRGDSTFALMLEGEKRGHALYHYTPERLAMRDGRIEAVAGSIEEARAAANAKISNVYSGSRFAFVNAVINRILDAA